MPASVKDAVLARLRQVSDGCRDAVERLSVVPSLVPDALAFALLGSRLEALAEAELAGLVEARPGGIGFRHELARRAIEQSHAGHPAAAAQPGRRAHRRRLGRAAAAPRGRGG